MADTIDDAQAYNELHQEVSLKNQALKNLPETHPDFDGEHCVEAHCGVRIPNGRLALRKVRCVDCQELLEKRQRLEPYNRPVDNSPDAL